MKKFLFPILFLLLLGGCAKGDMDEPEYGIANADGTVTMYFQVGGAPETEIRAEGFDDSRISTLQLWVFDKDHLFIESAIAEKLTRQNDGTYTFKAKLRPSDEKRYIHVVANMPEDYLRDKDWEYYDERYVVSSVHIKAENIKTNIPMWQRVEVGSIKAGQKLFSQKIELIRTTAKIELFDRSHTAGKKLEDMQYIIYNACKEGTLAPYNGESFVENFLTQAMDEGNSYNKDTNRYDDFKDAGLKDPGNSITKPSVATYLFEQSNNLEVPDSHPVMIIRGKIPGEHAYKYYKIDIVHEEDADFYRIDFRRNHKIVININDIKDLSGGYNSIAEAVKGSFSNNFALNVEFEDFNSFSDGVEEIRVGKVAYVVFGETDLYIEAKYFRDKQIRDIGSDNELKAVILDGSDDIIDNYTKVMRGSKTLRFLPYDKSKGAFKVHIKDFDKKRVQKVKLLVYVQGNANLKRIVTIYGREKFRFENYRAVQTDLAQGSRIRFYQEIPKDYPMSLAPLNIRIYSEDFSPDPESIRKARFGMENGRSYLEVSIDKIPDDRKVSFSLLTNKQINSGYRLTLKTDPGYFEDIVYGF